MNLYSKKQYTSCHSRIFIAIMKLGIWIGTLIDNASVMKDNKDKLIIQKVQYRGDAKGIRQLRNQLTSVEESTAASIKIFCEGADFSFSQLIESLEKLPATDLA